VVRTSIVFGLRRICWALEISVGRGFVSGLHKNINTSPLRSIFATEGWEERDGISVSWMGKGCC